MQAFANVALPDSYGSSGDFYSQKGVAVFVSIFNNTAAFRILQHDPARTSEIQELQEQASAPGSFLIEGGAGIRMRNNVAGSVARVFVTVFEPTDPRIAGFNPTTVTISSTGTTTAGGGVSVLSYNEFTAPVTIAATTEATATNIVSAASITADGSTPILIEFFCPRALIDGVNENTFVLYEDGASIGKLAGDISSGVGASGGAVPIYASRRLTPLSGSRSYAVRAYKSGGAGTAQAQAGAGGSGNFVPGYIRIISGG